MPPSWRRDVEGAADLVEEIARIEGFDKLPEVAPPRATGMRPPPASIGESRARVGRRALAAMGYLEAITWSFCPQAHAKAFGGGDLHLVLANPIAAELDCMRPSALPNLLRAAQKNADRGFPDARLFEIGPAFSADGAQMRTIAAVWLAKPPRHWRTPAEADVFAIKRDCLAALEAIGAPAANLQIGVADAVYWHPGQAGVLRLGPKPVARFGVLHPRVLQVLDVDGVALAFEILIDALPAPKAKRARPPLDKRELMPLSRDFAFIVEEARPAGDLMRAIAAADKTLIANVALFDDYRGQGVETGMKSLAVEVTLQPKDKTLTDPEIEAIGAKIIAAAGKLGARLRA
jgi:phenylalanyl-tRNA synthetase beta chain